MSLIFSHLKRQNILTKIFSSIFPGLDKEKLSTNMEKDKSWQDFHLDTQNEGNNCKEITNSITQIFLRNASSTKYEKKVTESTPVLEKIPVKTLHIFTTTQIWFNNAKQKIFIDVLHVIQQIFYLFQPTPRVNEFNLID